MLQLWLSWHKNKYVLHTLSHLSVSANPIELCFKFQSMQFSYIIPTLGSGYVQ